MGEVASEGSFLPALAPGPGSYHQTPTIQQEKELRKLSKQVVDLVKQRQALSPFRQPPPPPTPTSAMKNPSNTDSYEHTTTRVEQFGRAVHCCRANLTSEPSSPCAVLRRGSTQTHHRRPSPIRAVAPPGIDWGCDLQALRY